VAERHSDRTVAAALGGATLARLVYVAYLGDDLGGPDSDTYDAAAVDFARHGLLSHEVTGMPFYSPGYPLVVAAHYELLGPHPFAVKLTQVALVAALTWVTYRLADRVLGPRVALVTGLGMSVSLAWLALPHPLMYEPWLALLVTAALLLLVTEGPRDGLRLLSTGALFGLACAFQAKFLLLLLLLPVVAALSRPPGRRLAASLALVAGAALVVAPFTLRNLAVYDEPVPVATKGGAELVYGNNPDATGGMENQPTRLPWCDGLNSYDRSTYLATGGRMTRCAIRLALENPGHEIEILPTKLWRFWATFIGPWEERNNWRHELDVRNALPTSIRRSGPFETADVVLSAAWMTAALLLLGFGGVLAVRRAGSRGRLLLLPILWLTAVHLATFGDPRFRIPILPLVWMLQATALVAVAERVSAGIRRRARHR
jgi:Dolichyl-phosphate-mannose-protein mannosyltransferase